MKVEITKSVTDPNFHNLGLHARICFPYLRTDELEQLHKEVGEYLSALPKPHPHAELMLSYAKDAQEIPNPWVRWEVRSGVLQTDWQACNFNPFWGTSLEYRRKENI